MMHPDHTNVMKVAAIRNLRISLLHVKQVWNDFANEIQHKFRTYL